MKFLSLVIRTHSSYENGSTVQLFPLDQLPIDHHQGYLDADPVITKKMQILPEKRTMWLTSDVKGGHKKNP